MPGRHRDLCWACNHGSTCINRGTADKPVFYCEEFDAYVSVSRVSVQRASKTTSNGRGISPERKGLCPYCEDRETCMMARPEGGVWHCEEYR